MTTYQSVHTGPEVDAAVAVLNDVQEIRTEVEGYKNTVVSLAGQVQTDAGNAAADALTASQAASDALDSKNAAYASEQAASGHAANADSARAQAVVARNGSEAARDEAWATEGRINQLLSDSEPTIDELRAAIRRIHYGDGPYPSLDLNFVGATMLDPRVTFTRASDATYWDAMGVLRVAQPNEPRFEYDPITGKSLGLLIEGQATNLLTYSSQPENWSKAKVDLTPSSVVSPDGDSPLGLMTENGETAAHYAFITATFESGKTYTASVFAKEYTAGSKRYLTVLLQSSDAFDKNYRVTVDLSDGSIRTVNSPVNANAEHVGNGIYRVSVTATAIGSGTSLVQFRLSPTFEDGLVGHEGDGVSGLYIWGAQLEEGSHPSSYIKTEASQVTRAADSVMVDWDEFSSSYREEGFTVAFHAETFTGSGTPRIFSIQGASVTNNSVFAGFGTHPVKGPLSSLSVQVWKNGDGISLPSPLEVANKAVIGAVSYQPDKYSALTNDQPIISRSLPSGLPSREDLDRLYLGRDNGPSNHLNGYMRRISFFPRAFNDEQLERLVTL